MSNAQKANLRLQIDEAVKKFLTNGGKVQKVDPVVPYLGQVINIKSNSSKGTLK